jgi:hypothetical protein
MNWRDLLVLIWGVLAICASVFFITLYLTWPALSEECTYNCNDTTFVLQFQGHDVSIGRDMSLDECEELLAEIDPQTPGFTELECVEVDVLRQKI